MSPTVPASARRHMVAAFLLACGCGAPESFHDNSLDGGGVGGMPAAGSGGGVGPATGGAPGMGGMIVGSGGATASGGAVGSGGRPGTGGAAATGGSPVGGAGVGGRANTGGVAPMGGAGVGGRANTGGAAPMGGAVGTGGAPATGGRVGAGGGTGAGGAPGAGVVFVDDFESGAGKWITTMPTSDWSVVTDGTMVYKEGAAPSNVWRGAAAGNSAWTNIEVEARVKVLAFNGSSSSYLVGVCARVQDAQNRYCLGLRSDGKLAIRKTIGGSGSSSASVNVANGIMVNAWYTARIQVIGSAITGTLLLNGAQLGVATDTDTAITSGGIQLGTQNATAQFDDVKVTTR